MKRLVALIVVLVIVAVVPAAGYVAYRFWWPGDADVEAVEPAEPEQPRRHTRGGVETYETVRTEYHKPPVNDRLELRDDLLADKHPPLDDTLVDSRPLGDWELNASAAVIKLDCPMIRPDSQAGLLVLRPSYAEALKAATWAAPLPSANLLDGAAKQFDDGLYAAVDLACYRGELGPGPAAPELIAAIFAKLPEGSPARPFLGAALHLAGRPAELTEAEARTERSLLDEFDADETRSKPIGFYTWTPELGRVWKFYRFLQYQFHRDLSVPRAIAAVLRDDAALLDQYRAINAFYGRLTNPLICLPVSALIGAEDGDKLDELASRRGAWRPTVAVFPPSTSREAVLFEALFYDTGVPPGVNLMSELIRRIRSGEVKLEPGKDSGWYQYQAYALETMLLPSKGQEEQKLMLTAPYKRRLIEAFKALITKRRETHVRQLHTGESKTAEEEKPAPLERAEVRPRLRLEPCATFYLRTARAYAFLGNFLTATAGRERLASLHGLKKDGLRGPNLADELAAVRLRFYGFYLLTCEDIGMRPKLLPDEPVDREAACKAASAWLANVKDDPDLACDTRVAVPIFIDRMRGKTRIWATLGVRLTPLDASYARAPMVRPGKGGGPWQDVKPYQLDNSHYVIPVEEFAEIELDGMKVLTREELRKVCDRCKTKELIVEALSGRQ